MIMGLTYRCAMDVKECAAATVQYQTGVPVARLATVMGATR